ncbi:NAD-dependent epimerase/dehydratase family protein [Streptomyces sp. NPDC060030]|uniref:NAD-dependent epimerase/dehydratase family protein n=1 Tax=Streptomyces sp. NPDC060030 TaxID=3347042 RepID=UPI0036AFAAD4
MRIIGHGFLARSIRPLAGSHPRVVAFAAGVSSGDGVAEDQFAREAALLYDTLGRCLRSGRRLVYFSTSSAGMYGLRHGAGREDGPVRPSSPYGRHKLAMEEVIRNSGADHLILRLAYPVGPGQRPHQFLPSLVAQVRRGRVRVHRGARRDLIDVRHAVSLLESLLHEDVSRQVVNIASGWEAAVEDIVGHLEHRTGVVAEHHTVDVPAEGPVSTERMHGLVPKAAELGFGPCYYRQVIDSYLAAVAPSSPA